jgi:tetratricopeptide (TPR) repeat protein
MSFESQPENQLEVTQHPESVLARQFLIADMLFASGQDDEALQAYLDYLKLVDRDEDRLFSCYKNIGNIYVRLGEYDLAEDYYNRAYALDPTSVDLRVNFGTLEIQKDRLDKALQHFRDALYSNPRCGKAWVGLALIHRSLGDADLAFGNLISAAESEGAHEMSLQLLLDWSIQDQRADLLKRYVDTLKERTLRTSSQERFLQSATAWLCQYFKDLSSDLRKHTDQKRGALWVESVFEEASAS